MNVFEYAENEARTFIFPIHKTSFRFKKVVNLLLVRNGSRSHYVLIKSLPAFLRLKTKHLNRMHTCEYCYRTFARARAFVKHVIFCATGKPAISMPDVPILKFKNYQHRVPNIITIYGDFEAYQVKIDKELTVNTSLISEQRPTGFGYVVVSPYPQLCKPVYVYRGPDAADVFVKAMVDECREVEHILNTVQLMIFTAEDEAAYLNSTICGICQEPLDWSSEIDRVCRDHDHVTGRLPHSWKNFQIFFKFVGSLREACQEFVDTWFFENGCH